MSAMYHRYWHGDAEPDEWISKTLRSLGPVSDWTDDSLPAHIVEWLDAGADQVAPADVLRHRANMVRLWLLSVYGGVWVDHDVVLFEDVAQWARPFMAAHGTACNCVMGFDPGHPMIVAALAAIRSKPDNPKGRSVDVSGERLLDSLRTPEVQLVSLPMDSAGSRLYGARPWGVHLFASGRHP